MTTWQPIETAPKDGTEILGLEGEVIGQMKWRSEPYRKTGWHLSQLVWGDESTFSEPTHWMPKPEKP